MDKTEKGSVSPKYKNQPRNVISNISSVQQEWEDFITFIDKVATQG